jgi:ectoine hydroxylase-related dioxygenase (phytanoyl-CoA dioxygenase family)
MEDAEMEEALRKAYREDGAVLIKGCLGPDQLAQCRAAYDWAIANPGPHASKMYAGTGQRSHVDNCNPQAKPRLDDLVASLPLGRTFAELWGSEHAWYFAEEVFLKEGGVGARTLWHQDTSYLPWAGQQGDGAWPRLPDVEAQRRANPAAYDILSWATEPGDVLMLHPASLHGGAPVDAAFPDRHTLVLRFFGDDATFSPLPDESRSGYARNGVLFRKEMAALEPGAPFRSPVFRQVV